MQARQDGGSVTGMHDRQLCRGCGLCSIAILLLPTLPDAQVNSQAVNHIIHSQVLPRRTTGMEDPGQARECPARLGKTRRK